MAEMQEGGRGGYNRMTEMQQGGERDSYNRLNMPFWKKYQDKIKEWLKKHGLKATKTMASALPIPKPFVQLVFEKLEKELQRVGIEGIIQLHAIAVIDPNTQRYANISIRTSDDMDMLESVPLLTQFRPFSLVKNEEKAIDSAAQMFQTFANRVRAECKVDGYRVKTFDNVEYHAPISRCYSVLAKDCSNEEPRFMVLMKSSQSGGTDKKLKVITPSKSIECEKDQQQEKLICVVNGQQMMEQQQWNDNGNNEEVVQFSDSRKTEATIEIRGVSIRFDGKNAWIKISSQYKNGQCGLCGHYDGEPENEWRMNNNEQTDDLIAFHRSYSLQQDEECSVQDHQNFYEENKKNFLLRPFHTDSDSASRMLMQQREFDNDNDNDNTGTGMYSSFSSKMNEQQQSGDNWNNQDHYYNGPSSDLQSLNTHLYTSTSQNIDPVLQTRYLEFNDKVCFSVEPVLTCPRGTHSILKRNNDADVQTRDLTIKKKVMFTCLNRSIDETRRLLEQARRGAVLNMRGYPQSFQENVRAETKCQQYY